MPAFARTPLLPEATRVGALSAQLRRPRPRLATSAMLKGFVRPRRRDPLIVQMGRRDKMKDWALDTAGRGLLTISLTSPRNSTQPIQLRTAARDSPRRIAPLAIVTG